MAGHWLASLGSKLFDAGMAYLEQSNVVQQLAQMPVPQARLRFRKFVAGLSPAAHAGFGVTLTTLANNSNDPQMRRFILSMLESLDAPERWLAETAAPAPLASPQPRAGADDDGEEGADEADSVIAIARQLDIWLALPGQGAAQAAAEHLHALPLPRLQHWCDRLQELVPALDRQVAEHRDDEVRIAAGRYIEDQHHYRMLRLAGNPPDAGWLKQLQAMQRAHGFSVQLLEAAQALAAERARPSPAAPVAPAAPAVSADADATITTFRALLDNELASGRVRGERAQTYRRLLDKIEALSQQQENGQITAAQAMHRMQGLMEGFMPFMANPGAAEQRASTRGRELLRHAGAVKVAALREKKLMPPEATAAALDEIWGDTMKVQEQCASEHDDDKLLALETGLLRPAALAAHELRLTQHALLARPLWATGPEARAANQLFLAGAGDVEALLEPLARTRGLSIANPRHGQHHGQMRWEALAASQVAVFDLRGADRLATLARSDPDRARALCAAAYELGLAFALGTPVLVLAGPDDVLPFDIDVEPLRLQPDAGRHAEGEAISAALDLCLYGVQREPHGSSIATTLAQMRRLTDRHPERRSIEGMGWLDEGLARCPAGFAAAAAQVLRRLDTPGGARWRLLRPAWPAAYPAPDDRRCFHVMPFGQPWSDEVRDVARIACVERGLAYRRGDEAEDGRIIHAIWDDICRAQVVLVELGGPNLNVMIELAMAHAIGRPVLAVQHAASPDIRPAHIGKLRVHRYADTAGLMGILATRLQTTLQGSAA